MDQESVLTDFIDTKSSLPTWSGNCPEHGEWENEFKDGCVYEQWEEEKRKGGGLSMTKK